MRYYFQSRREAMSAREVVLPKLAPTHACEMLTVDAGHYLHVYETSHTGGREYDLSGTDLSAFGVFAPCQ